MLPRGVTFGGWPESVLINAGIVICDLDECIIANALMDTGSVPKGQMSPLYSLAPQHAGEFK